MLYYLSTIRKGEVLTALPIAFSPNSCAEAEELLLLCGIAFCPPRLPSPCKNQRTKTEYADMAELADALDSGSSRGNSVQVQLLLSAPPLKAFVYAALSVFLCLKFSFKLLVTSKKTGAQHKAVCLPSLLYLQHKKYLYMIWRRVNPPPYFPNSGNTIFRRTCRLYLRFHRSSRYACGILR